MIRVGAPDVVDVLLVLGLSLEDVEFGVVKSLHQLVRLECGGHRRPKRVRKVNVNAVAD